MAYQALYRERRPRRFSDVIGQEHITTTLKNEITTGRVAHAYLFSGTRGTGKTTCAKILAKALNCLDLKDGEPCGKCENCVRIDSGLSMDVLEQDAATNNKVDDIRDLIDEVQYPPQEGKYKVYILDEAHMLTMGAVNAFLKTLEEPPENTVFILATTDPQKLPVTILSRCQRFEFKRIKSQDIARNLRQICDEKGIFADDRALQLIAGVSEGAMRDALSILDQCISMGEGKVEYEFASQMLGLAGRGRIFDTADDILNHNLEGALKTVDEMIDDGKDPYFIVKDLLAHFRNILITKIITGNPQELIEASSEDIENYRNQSLMARDKEIIKIIRYLQEAEDGARKTSQGRIFLELSLVKICSQELDYSMDAVRSQVEELEKKVREGISVSPQSPETRVSRKENPIRKPESPKNTEKIPEPTENKDSKITAEDVESSWNEILEALRARRQMVIRASLTEARIKSTAGGIIHIEFPESFSHNRKRLEKPEYVQILSDTASMILGEKVGFKFSVEREKEEGPGNIEDIIREKGLSDITIVND